LARVLGVISEFTLKYPDGRIERVESGELLEPLEGGELSYHLIRFGRLTEATARAFFIQIVSALIHFQKHTGCCHRDIKPWNICLNSSLTQTKIIDFGQATPFDKTSIGLPLSGFVSGTPQYMAPELSDSECTDLSKVDTYACAVVLINMLTGCEYVSQNQIRN
jgi:serine/threonine protein kinase